MCTVSVFSIRVKMGCPLPHNSCGGLHTHTHTHTHTNTLTHTHTHTHVLTDKKPPSKVHKLPCWLTVPIKAQYTSPKGGILHLSKRLSNNSHFHHLRNDSKNEGLDEFALKKVVHAKMKTLPFDVDKKIHICRSQV